MADREPDLVISGGGVVGLALAAALDGRGLRIAVIEAREPPPWDPARTDLRVSSITAASRRMLAALGVWESVAARRVSPFEAIHAWDAGGGAVHFHAADVGEAWLGHIVENDLLQRMLYEHVTGGCNDVRLLCPAGIRSLDAGPDQVRVRLDDGRRLRSRLLVAADGARSVVREQVGIPVRRRDYGQQGLVATVRTRVHHGRVARQRFLPGGPVALLPLADGACSIVWSLPTEDARRLLAAADGGFMAALSEATQEVLGPVVETGPRRAFPLQALHAERYIDERVALVGDAAHVIHPLAGQGVNLGLLDAAALAEVVQAAVARGRDPGGRLVLRRYERWRRGDNLSMQVAMDGFHWLFSNRDPVRHGVRNLGFELTDRLPLLKRRFTEYAMGYRGDLPALARK